jgi:hypothetical protein
VLGVPWVEEKQAERTPERIWGSDAEAWELRPRTFHRMLGQLARRPRVLVLSGDVHYAFTITAGLWAGQPYGESMPLPTPARSALAQLTASALKNETNSFSLWNQTTDRLQGGGWNVLPLGLPFAAALEHNPDDWAGWSTAVTSWTPRGRANTRWLGRLARSPVVLNITDVGDRPHIHVPEHWRYRFSYLVGRREAPVAITPLTRPPVRSSKRATTSWMRAVGAVLTEVRVGDDGTELVGNNNLGEIRFGAGARPGASALPVSHILWWNITDSGKPEYSTAFRFTLDPTDARAIPGQVWEQRP